MLSSIRAKAAKFFTAGNTLQKSVAPPVVAEKLGKLLPLCSTVELNDFDHLIQFPSMTTQAERHFLFLLSVTGPLRGDIIEIGSWLGGTTSYLAKGCQVAKNGKVIAIDHFRGNPGKESFYREGVSEGETIFECFKRNISVAGVSEYVQPLGMDSLSARETIDKQVRLVFIDGNHDYESVKQDIQLWEPMLMQGGHLVFHDFTNAEGVAKAVTEFIDAEKYPSCVLVDSLLICSKAFEGSGLQPRPGN